VCHGRVPHRVSTVPTGAVHIIHLDHLILQSPHATRGARPPVQAPGEIREISVEAGTYEAGRDELRGQVPERWRIMNLRRA
jgi:hypothetical protein